MKTFKNLFISFEEWNQESLDRAVAEAERLGYRKLDNINALKFEWEWILEMNKYWDYFTSIYSNEQLIEDFLYKEHFITPNPNTITVDWVEYREVYVSSESVEDALEKKEKRILLYELPWKKRYKYQTVYEFDEKDFINYRNYNISFYDYIAEIPLEEPTERKLICTDTEWEEVQKILKLKK